MFTDDVCPILCSNKLSFWCPFLTETRHKFSLHFAKSKNILISRLTPDFYGIGDDECISSLISLPLSADGENNPFFLLIQ